MEPTSESPLRRDEPVYSSRKWLLIAVISAFAWLGFTLYTKAPKIFELDDWGEELLWLASEIAVQIFLIGLLMHALRAVWRSGERRSFDLMAVAVKAQRPFILCFALLAATGTVFFSVWAHQDRMFNTGLRQARDSIKASMAHSNRTQKP
jgi:hypothetical protein